MLFKLYYFRMVHKLTDFRTGEALHQPTIQTVITTAAVVKQQVAAMWWNDSEYDQIDTIVKKAQDGTLWLTQAILNIELVRDNKHWNGWHGLQW